MTATANMNTNETFVRNIDGVYFKLPSRILPLVDLILRRSPTGLVTATLRSVTGRTALTVNDSLDVLRGVFGSFGVEVALDHLDGNAVFVLKRRSQENVVSGGVIRLKATLLPGRVANAVARVLSWSLNPTTACMLLAVSIFTLGYYGYAYGGAAFGISYLVRTQKHLSLAGNLLVLGIMTGSFLLHELGHCAAAARYGQPVRRVGVGIYWLFPVMFSDVSSTWELPSKQRVVVDIGGVYFQLIVCTILALVAVSFRNSTYGLASQICIVMNLLSMAASLNPMLKLDGYWVFADSFKICNLRRQSEEVLIRLIRKLRRSNRVAVERTTFGWPLVLYAVLSVMYGFFFTGYMCVSVWEAARYAVEVPAAIWHRLVMLSQGRHYIAIIAASLEIVGKEFPLIVAPVVLVSAFSGVSGFLGRLAGAGGFLRKARL